MKIPRLTKKEARAILKIENGADIYSYALAGILRQMQRKDYPVNQLQGPKKNHKQMQGALFSLTDAQMYKGDGTDQMPYFGAIACRRGLQLARIALASKARRAVAA